MAVLRYGGLLIVGVMILTGCGSLAVKDQPVDQPPKSSAEQPPVKGSPAAKKQPVERPTKSGAEQLPASGSRPAKEQPVDQPAPSRAEQLPAKGSRPAEEHPVDQPTLSGAEQLLAKGIKSYEDGEYKTAATYYRMHSKPAFPGRRISRRPTNIWLSSPAVREIHGDAATNSVKPLMLIPTLRWMRLRQAIPSGGRFTNEFGIR